MKWKWVGVLGMSAAAAWGAHKGGMFPAEPCPRPWVFFDLGDTLLECKNGLDKVRYMPGALAYLQELREKGYPIGLLTNYPDDEGPQIEALKRCVADGWIDTVPMDWSFFREIYVAPSRAEYKNKSPVLFRKALERARADGCGAVYQTEDAQELGTIRESGMPVYLVGNGESFYLPEKQIRSFIRRYARRAH